MSLSSFGPDDDTPVFVISVAAELAGMHPQTLRQYDRLGLVSPTRTAGRIANGRQYQSRVQRQFLMTRGEVCMKF